ncbi:hypothetical protein Aduo_009539 [Ancylostoma duodenale]
MFENMTDEYVSDEDLSFIDEEDEATEKKEDEQHQPDPFPFLNLPEELQTEVLRKLSTKDWSVVRLVSRYMRDFLERHWTSLPPRKMLPMVAGGSCNISMRICRAFDQDLHIALKLRKYFVMHVQHLFRLYQLIR